MSESPSSRTVTRLRPFTSTIFAEMTALATRTGAINLGQGFPDTDGPASLLDAACHAIHDGRNQYAPGPGVPELREAIAADRALRYGIESDPDDEVLVTVGATEAIAAAIVGLVEPGSEVVLIEPYYDSYAAAVAMAGATRRTATMVTDGDGFALDVDSLRAAVTDRTAMLVVNTPHNPTGAVYTDDELRAIAEIAVEHDLIVLSDEVYEHLTFDRPHVPLAQLPGMRERTVTVSSAGKTFSVTGWKIGWACGPAELVAGVRAAKQFMSFTAGSALQPAVAHALRHEMPWVAALRDDLARKRDILHGALSDAGLRVMSGGGTYFLCADIGPLGEDDGDAFCRSLPERVGVAAVPLAAFTDHPGRWNHMVRFAFCKRDDVLADAARRLKALRGA
ncbi:pyridoxal phosphate-dependent aminotransferase [Rhodococcus sp. HNM0569]|uniref:pyridoxal phosphate-dependent aminotransferase n=1 Tax=Rhodococcus sp. HNM0569 TaxID=2716340 RepID=UPI00146EB20E|nr:pyridoxal phosphate-dependent aminotransferase [Rhodococcus sp. HNM0569]NLU82395.1 pyridoxal phosphate-dependent aminotransferase [Rhodococcus sp. HNM0569]